MIYGIYLCVMMLMMTLMVWLVRQVHARQSGSSQVSSASAPEMIDDVEESERVSQMLQRDSLVRGLGVTELVHRLLDAVHNNDPTSVIQSNSEPAAAGSVADRPPPNHVSSI